jgi:hypothetical protein
MMETYRIHRYRDYWLVRNYRTGEEKFFRERYEAEDYLRFLSQRYRRFSPRRSAIVTHTPKTKKTITFGKIKRHSMV